MRTMNKAIWPFQVTIPFSNNEQSDSMYNWCKDKYQRWYLNGNTFCFQDEKEFLMFCLRWAS
jgi:hypothetical protein